MMTSSLLLQLCTLVNIQDYTFGIQVSIGGNGSKCNYFRLLLFVLLQFRVLLFCLFSNSLQYMYVLWDHMMCIFLK